MLEWSFNHPSEAGNVVGSKAEPEAPEERSTTMPDRQVIEGALALVESGWCKGHYAELADGQTCFANNPDAVAFCMDGALYRSSKDLGLPDSELQSARETVMRETSSRLPYWNHEESRTFDEVRETLRRAAFLGGLPLPKGAG